jgi:predicted chitinase
MDPEEIQGILNQVYSSYPWASEETVERMAELSRSSTIKTTALATAIAQLNGVTAAKDLTSNIRKVKIELDRRQAKINARIDSINSNTRTVGRAITGGGQTGLESMVELAGAGAEAMHASAKGLANMSKKTAKTGWIASYFTGGAVALTGVGAVVAKVIASQEKEMRSMIDMGMALGDTANYTHMRRNAVDTGMKLGEYAAMTQNAATLMVGIGGDMVSGQGMMHGFLTDPRRIKEVKNFGYSPKELSGLLAEETEQLYKLNEVNNLNSVEQNKVIESFQTANQMGMYLADTLGVQRGAMLQARNMARENDDFQLAMNQNTAFLEEKYGKGAASNVREAADWISMLGSATLGEEMTSALMDVFIGTASDIQFDESAINNIQDEQLRKTLQLLDPEVFKGFMTFFEDGAKGDLKSPAETASRFQGLIKLIKDSPTLAGLDPDSVAVNKLIASVQLIPESYFMGTEAEIKAKLLAAQDGIDGADDAIEIVGGMSKAFLRAQHEFTPGFETMGSVMGVLEGSIGTFADFWRDMFGLDHSTQSASEVFGKDNADASKIIYSDSTISVGGTGDIDTTTQIGYNDKTQKNAVEELRVSTIKESFDIRDSIKEDQNNAYNVASKLKKLKKSLNLDNKFFSDNLMDIVEDAMAAVEKAKAKGDNFEDEQLKLAIAEANLANALKKTKPLEDELAAITEQMDQKTIYLDELRNSLSKIATVKKRNELDAYGEGATLQGIVLAQLKAQGIVDVRAQANILGMIQGESAFKMVAEQSYANTSNERIREVMGSRLPENIKDDELDKLKKDPKKFFDTVYPDLGGYDYRGRGFIQLTGEENYKLVGEMIGVDLFGNPDLMLDPTIAAAASAAYFSLPWWEKYKNDLDNMDTVYKVVYGKTATSSGRIADLKQRTNYADQFMTAMTTGELTAAIPSTQTTSQDETTIENNGPGPTVENNAPEVWTLEELQDYRDEIYNDGPMMVDGEYDTDMTVDWESQLQVLDEKIAKEMKRLELQVRETENEGNP